LGILIFFGGVKKHLVWSRWLLVV